MIKDLSLSDLIKPANCKGNTVSNKLMKEYILGQNRTGKTNNDNDNEILQTLGTLYMHAIMSTRLHCIQDLIKVCSEETFKVL